MNAYKTVIAVTVATLLTGPALAQSNQDMQGMNMGAQATQPITGKGVVKKVDPAKKTINLNHEAIPAISWPAMTMDFQVAPNVDLSKVQPGQPVDFRLEKGNGGNYTVTSVTPAAK
ncbi:copper-binding protein [Skermanella mucosa]|uniref:copper-binding protein n=1 Tax=Skermanella mucosa TaxID=1789672 RepID=UPI00192B4E5D|nr:copper-binding protein [Skermanella mucosa]UEM21309.1 copper-binding protein [Skermanella mucosa]